MVFYSRISVNQSNRQLARKMQLWLQVCDGIFSTRIWETVNIVTWHDLFDAQGSPTQTELQAQPEIEPEPWKRGPAP